RVTDSGWRMEGLARRRRTSAGRPSREGSPVEAWSATLAVRCGLQHNFVGEQVRNLLHGLAFACGLNNRSASMRSVRPDSISRRQFLSAAAASAAAIAGAPAVITASKTDSKVIVGEGDYKYEIVHEWPQLPDKFTWQTTHNVAVDKAGNVYVIHEGRAEQ